MFEIAVPAPLEKYVAARKEIELGSITLLVYNVGTVTGSNKMVSTNVKVNGKLLIMVGRGFTRVPSIVRTSEFPPAAYAYAAAREGVPEIVKTCEVSVVKNPKLLLRVLSFPETSYTLSPSGKVCQVYFKVPPDG
jgi:hypothetical protein